MARWEVRTRKGAVTVEGGNWLLALGAALPALELDASVLSRLVCDVQSDGVVRIVDPISRTPMLVRQLPDEVRADGARPVVPVGVVAAKVSPEAVEEDDPVMEEDDAEVDAAAPPPPSLAMPVREPAPAAAAAAPPPPPVVPSVSPSYAPQVPQTSPAAFKDDDLATLDDIDVSELAEDPASYHPDEQPAPPDLAEDLFIASGQVSNADDIESAAQETLSVLRDFVAAESSSVLFASINDTELRFLAADGPKAGEVRTMTVPLGTGLAGFCFDTGAALIIRNAHRDPRHNTDVDDATGYRTQEMLTVALRDSEGGIHGCLQLLNPPDRFFAWHLEAATTLGHTLADFIRHRA